MAFRIKFNFKKYQPLYTPLAIFAGCLLIAVVIYTSGGITITVGGKTAGTATPTVEELFKNWAKELKLNTSAFNSCFDSRKYQSEITKDTQDAQNYGIQGTPNFVLGKSSSSGTFEGLLIQGAYPYDQFKSFIESELTGRVAGKKGSESTRLTVSTDDDPVLGDPNAPLTMVEFSDATCPYCGKFFLETFPQIRSDYIDTGKLKFVFRDLPIHGESASKAAEAAQCANEQGKFWEYWRMIFSNQELLQESL